MSSDHRTSRVRVYNTARPLDPFLSKYLLATSISPFTGQPFWIILAKYARIPWGWQCHLTFMLPAHQSKNKILITKNQRKKKAIIAIQFYPSTRKKCAHPAWNVYFITTTMHAENGVCACVVHVCRRRANNINNYVKPESNVLLHNPFGININIM